jgi:redox-sensitive bicupin YhaK (pirin superfamily)
MSLRAVKQIIETKPTLEGAGVKLQRAFGFGKTKEFDPFLLLDDFRNENPADYLAASRPSPMCWRAKWRMATAWATGAA